MSYRLAAVRSAVDSGMGGEFAFVEDERRSRQLHRLQRQILQHHLKWPSEIKRLEEAGAEPPLREQ